MQHDFWHDRWNTGRIAFHEPKGDPRLPERWSAIGAPPTGRVLVTLCGKSRDMAWLAIQGHEVIGVELSAIAARDFFAESGLPFVIEPRGRFQAYCSTQANRNVTILVGDFFDLDAALLGEVCAVYDRAATVALPADLRSRYAQHLARLVPASAVMLLMSMEYDQSRMSGPPFSVPDADVRALFTPGFVVDVLGEVSGPEIAGTLRQRGLQTLTERSYRLRRRD
ncbi:MAG: thiopurine S-methyltransferase [Planctomycetota bacterium]